MTKTETKTLTPKEFDDALDQSNTELFGNGTIDMIVQLEDRALEMQKVTHFYSMWLRRMIQGFYEYTEETRLTNSRKSKRAYARFMNKWNYKIEKKNDEDLIWTFSAGKHEDHLRLIARLEILKADGDL